MAPAVRVRDEAKVAFMRLLFEMQVVLGRSLTQAEAFALLVQYAEGDSAGFLDWAARQGG